MKGESMSNQSIYERITGAIVKKLEEGVVPWKESWKGVGFPKNGVSRKYYRGVNLLLLALQRYNSPYWLTFNQARNLGGSVKAGEKGTPVIFWKWLERRDSESDETLKVPMLRQYTVFNVLQCEGIEFEAPKAEFEGIEECERVVSEFLGRETGLTLENKKSYPFYLPLTDVVNVPPMTNFKRKEDYYTALFHELTHATGHIKRLDRGLQKPRGFASIEYSKEELIAELGASFLCGITGIENQVLDDSAAYIKGWIEALSNDSKLLVQAGAKAQHAVDYILGTTIEAEE